MKTFQDYLAAKRPLIQDKLHLLLTTRGSELEERMRGGKDLMYRLVDLSLRGKNHRGCLVFLGYDLVQQNPLPYNMQTANSLAGVAAAVEVAQSALLVHDDIMDRDSLRRGRPSLHVHYSKEFSPKGAPLGSTICDYEHLGNSLATCAGDAGFFEAFALLSRSLAQLPQATKLIQLCAEEFSSVCLAQMQDVINGASPLSLPNAADVISEENSIITTYLYKTARYSFSLPLMLGAILGAGDKVVIDALSEIGNCMGLAFQIRDDELGLFSDEETTGKSQGGDLIQGKHTLLWLYMQDYLATKKVQFPDTSLEQFKNLAETKKIRMQVQEKAVELKNKALDIIQSIEKSTLAHSSSILVLKNIAEWTITRNL